MSRKKVQSQSRLSSAAQNALEVYALSKNVSLEEAASLLLRELLENEEKNLSSFHTDKSGNSVQKTLESINSKEKNLSASELSSLAAWLIKRNCIE